MTSPRTFVVGLVSISDRASDGVYEDRGIPSLESWLAKAILSPYQVISRLIPDEQSIIEQTLIELVDKLNCDLVLTTGGTGPSRRDVTPEATLAVCTRELPGFGEQMRAISLAFVPTAILSRQIGALREINQHSALIINLPGQPKAIEETLEGLPKKGINGIFSAIPYCIELIGGPSIETDPETVVAFRPKSAVRPHIIDSLILEPEKKADASIIWLHGLGADGTDFVDIKNELSEFGAPLESTRFILPHAPLRPISMNGGYEMRGWFDLYSLESIEKEDHIGLAETYSLIKRLIAEEQSRGIARHRIFLAGFSQGGCMSLYALLRLANPIGGVVALSCYLPLHNKIDTLKIPDSIATPTFIGYGLQDNIVPPQFAQDSANCLQSLGADIQVHAYPMDHALCNAELKDIAAFLSNQLQKQ